MHTQHLETTLAIYQHRLRQHDLPLSTVRMRNAEAVVFPHGVHVLEDGVPLTWRPVGLELAAELIATT
jgi:hypothetical protein